jgi:hypothetical protein
MSSPSLTGLLCVFYFPTASINRFMCISCGEIRLAPLVAKAACVGVIAGVLWPWLKGFRQASQARREPRPCRRRPFHQRV